MKRIKFIICALTAMMMLSAHNAMATDANVTDAHFEQNGAAVHTLSNGSLDCIIKASGTGNTAVMINAVYEKDTNKLVGVKYVNPTGNEFKNTIDITDAQKVYVTMCVWDSLENAVAKTQVYSIAAADSAPENPWRVEVNNKGAIAFEWGACEDNLKTAGYRIYKNGERIGETTETSFTDSAAKWYESNKAEYKITAYDEYGNESDGTVLKDISTDNSDIAAILFTQPNITEKMSLYFATGKETDDTWYGYNTAETKDGVMCRCIPPDSRAVFKYSAEFKNRIGDGERDAVIRVTYYDDNTDAFRVSYVGKGARYTDITVDKTNTNKWITKELKVSDFVAAYIDPKDGAKTQDENVDLSIWSKASTDKGDVVDTNTYISEIQVVLEGDAPEPQPTTEPGETPKPTAEPTPVPTIDPADIKTASVNFLEGQTTATCSESEYNLINIFWAGKNNDGQISNTGWYGYNYGAEQNGEKCRAIDDNKRLVLIYNNPLNEAIGSEPKKTKLRVKYLDNGTDKIRVSYISKTKRYTDLNIEKTDSGEWKWAEFTVADMVNESDQQDGAKGGYQDGRVTDEGTLYPDGPNFTIWSRGSGESESVTEYISAFEIVFDDGEEPEPEPSDNDIVITQNTDNTTLSNIAFTWQAVENAAGYNVYRNDEKLTDAPVTEAAYTDEELLWYEDYTYKVEAVDNLGDVIGEGTAKLTVSKDNFGGIKLFRDSTGYDKTYTGEKMTVYWGGTNQHVNNTVWFGYTEGAEVEGVECRKILAAHDKGDGSWITNQRISLRFDESMQTLIGTAPRSAKIRVHYYDNGTDGFRIAYMSTANSNKNVVVPKTDTNEWKWYDLDVTDLVNKSSNGNGLQDESTYFSIWGMEANNADRTLDSDTYISEIQFILE